MIISNDYVYGLEESIVVSGYPMLAKPLTEEEFDKEVDELYFYLNDSNFLNDLANHIKNGNYPKYEFKEDSVYVYIESFENNPCIISYCDLKTVFYNKIHKATNGYYCVNKQLLHRYLMSVGDDLVVDHINRNICDNRRSNLRICTKKENCRNTSSKSQHKTSKVIGVCVDPNRPLNQRYRAYIMVDGKQIYLGRYETEHDAIIARLNAEVLYFQEFSPQIHLFEEYGIEYDFEVPQDNSVCLKKALQHYKRIKSLASAPSGSGHDNALKGIIVQFDCNAPQYFWQQLQRYHFIDFVSSMSKMHCLTKFDDTMIADGTSYTAIKNMEYAVQDYIAGECDIDTALRNVPMGLTYTARMSTNYLQLKTIYKQRRHHRSIEWQAFCDWIEELPLAQELIIGNTFKNEPHYTGEQKE